MPTWRRVPNAFDSIDGDLSTVVKISGDSGYRKSWNI